MIFTNIGLVGCEVVHVGLGVPEAGRLGDSSPWCCTFTYIGILHIYFFTLLPIYMYLYIDYCN